MEWLNDLIKQINLSKPVAIAMFVSTLILWKMKLWFGIDALESIPLAIVIWLCLFSGSLIVTWVLAALYKSIKNLFSKVLKRYQLGSLTELQKDFLVTLGSSEAEHLYISRLDFKKIGATKLEVVSLFSDLNKKGLVYVGIQNSDYVVITEYGKEVAWRIVKKLRK